VFQLHDTRTGRAEPIRPAGDRTLRIYTCGPVLERRAHVGDLRSYLLADLIRRHAEHRLRFTVLACQDVADVAGPGGDGAQQNERAFLADCSALNLRPAEGTPRASDGIGLTIDMISGLVEAGHAYPAGDGSVYFDARSFPGYGELSGNRLADTPPGGGPAGEAGDTRDAGDRKRFPADWALWTGSGQEPAWPAPWGTGFPVRSAQCSALSRHCLGDAIDLHAGGIDLCFPHHEHERAESNSAAGREAVRHWVHGERLLFDGRAMAGSGENVVLLPDLADRGLDPLALRLAFLEHPYRQPVNLTWDALEAANRTLRRWRELVADWANSPSKPMCAEVTSQITAAFDDDLDTPAALRALRSLEDDQEIPPGSKFETFAYTDQLLGLDVAREIGRAPIRPAG
jgi:cysteinyl-tRNA synthetase